MTKNSTTTSSDEFRSAIVSVVGRPNVGKSTLVNALVNKDLSITSVHPHTTRRQIRAIENGENYQIVYVDTPGIHKPKSELSEQTNEFAYEAATGVDLVIGVFDGSQEIGKGDAFVADRLKDLSNVFIVLNKCDVEKNFENVALRAKAVQDLIPNASHLFITSAFTKKNIHLIKDAIVNQLKPGPALFDKGTEHDLTDSELISELYREALIRLMRDELPSGILVIAKEDTASSKSDTRFFDIKVVVLRKSHKPIVIGKAGSVLEIAGSKARAKAEALIGTQLVLRARVIVDENWQSRADELDSYFF